MHEYGLVKNLVDSLLKTLEKEGVGPGQVREVSVRVGALEMHSEEAFRQSFEVVSRGGLLEGAKLSLTIVPPEIKCACGFSGPLKRGDADPHDAYPVAECPSCGQMAGVTGGRGVEDLRMFLVTDR